jgi:hypothetical protein
MFFTCGPSEPYWAGMIFSSFISADVVMIEKILNELSLQNFWHH